MILSDDIAETAIFLKDQYFDLQGLSAYCSLGVGTLREHIKKGKLPCFKVKGKILIRKSEFDIWMDGHRVKKKKDIESIADEAIKSLKMN